MNTARILAIAAGLLIAVGSTAPASARVTANGWMNGANSGLSTGDQAPRVTGFELPSGQSAK
jgi:hypothetical protein